MKQHRTLIIISITLFILPLLCFLISKLLLLFYYLIITLLLQRYNTDSTNWDKNTSAKRITVAFVIEIILFINILYNLSIVFIIVYFRECGKETCVRCCRVIPLSVETVNPTTAVLA